jgi:antibiotic biosynthesis monooxygenase (ABM) superfamily enzyme
VVAVWAGEHALYPLLVSGGGLDWGLPLVARLAVTTGVTVPLMTWVVMPRVTRLLHRWLYPGRRQ